MSKISYQVSSLIGDILSKDGNYVDLLSCNEYTLWYLIRQEGIKSFLPALGTKAFFRSPALEWDPGFDAFSDCNIQTILSNCREYFHLKPVFFEDGLDIHSFIRKAVDQGHFVYTVYDSYYDSMQLKKPVHDYHGHPITGYCDEKGVYLSIFEGEYEVKYEDMEQMILHSRKRSGTYFLKFFFLCRESGKQEKVSFGTIRSDCLAVRLDWRREIRCFEAYIKYMKERSGHPAEEQMRFVYRQRLLFNSVSVGLHYNFVFRLSLLEQCLGIRTGELKERFITNRKQAVLIANMYRKLYILLEKNDKFAGSYMRRLIQKTEELFVRENNQLLRTYENIIREELHR